MTRRPARRTASLDPLRHPDWCGRDHRCNLGEHRADPIVLEAAGLGRIVLTRVQGTDGRHHAEVRARVALADTEPYARVQLFTLVRDLRTLLARTTRTSARPDRAA